MEVNKYIERIGYKGKLTLNEECLKELHKCHVMSVPFEALDVKLGNKINLYIDKIYHKVIDKGRGGYCYELNYLFNCLLSKIGFESHLISARIYNNRDLGPEFDHMAIIVKLNEFWLVDVGYGDLFIEPVLIDSDDVQEDKFKYYKVVKQDEDVYLLTESLKSNHEFVNKYKFNTRPISIREFDDQNLYKQSSNESYFVQNIICTLPTKTGRKTILNNTYKVKSDGFTNQKVISNNEELCNLLENEFKIKIDDLFIT